MNSNPSTTQHKKGPLNIRAVFDLIMGVIYAAVGGFLAVSPYLKINLVFIEAPFVVIFGACCILYGGFRVYRGVKTLKQPL